MSTSKVRVRICMRSTSTEFSLADKVPSSYCSDRFESGTVDDSMFSKMPAYRGSRATGISNFHTSRCLYQSCPACPAHECAGLPTTRLGFFCCSGCCLQFCHLVRQVCLLLLHTLQTRVHLLRGLVHLTHDSCHHWTRLCSFRCSRKRSRAAWLSRHDSSGWADAEPPAD